MANGNLINSATTLDVRPSPGRDIRFPTTSSQSVFTFGNFRLERSVLLDFLDNTGSTLSYSPYSTLSKQDSADFDVIKIITTKENELNLNPVDPASYAYFGSFYTKVANAINNVVDNYPYAMLSSTEAGVSIYDYDFDKVQNFSSFKIPLSSVTNQGNIIYASGRTEQSEEQVDLFNETNQFSIQLSGNSQNPTTGDTFVNSIHKIRSYNYSAGTYLEFEIEGILLPLEPDGTTEFDYPLYIRPTRQRLGEWNRTLPNLEDQLINDGTFLVPDAETETFERRTFDWPRDIDGFAPDSFGNGFTNYATSILQAAREIDERKTNIMVRTMLPENYIDLDSQDQVYRKITTVYAEEFDKIKQYIDGLAYAHSVTYNGEESIPNKFISRLAKLLGAPLPNAFAAEDVLDYLAGEFDETGTPFAEYNLELWRRIMVNLVWLYKKRGTRDAISFVFKLIGAPDCMFNLEEFIYKVQNVVDPESASPTIADDGYPDLDHIQFIEGVHFQAGGAGRGDGQRFIQAMEPEYDPFRQVDNKKIYTGNTRNIVNSKELCADLRASRAIECDVMDWYELGYGWWKWGSTHVVFSGLTVPFEWQVEDIDTVVPDNLTGMTIYEWLDFIYMSNVNPRNRKTDRWQYGHTDTYRDLKKIYITYMLWTNGQESNRLTFRKLESFLRLVERNYQELVPFFVPSTSVLTCYGTVYTNSEFNRHRFVYRPGINDGSEFQVEIPPVFEPTIQAADFTTILSPHFEPPINAINVQANLPVIPPADIASSDFVAIVSQTFNPAINGANTTTIINEEITNEDPVPPPFNGTIIEFPE